MLQYSPAKETRATHLKNSGGLEKAEKNCENGRRQWYNPTSEKKCMTACVILLSTESACTSAALMSQLAAAFVPAPAQLQPSPANTKSDAESGGKSA